MRMIREIERLSTGAAPQIHILPLQFVNSLSFTTLMNSVYQDLHGLRTVRPRPNPKSSSTPSSSRTLCS